MMTREQMIEATYKRHGLGGRFDPAAVEAAVDRGIVDGDEIDVGNGITARVAGDVVLAIRDGKEIARRPLAEAREQLTIQRAYLLSRLPNSPMFPAGGGRRAPIRPY